MNKNSAELQRTHFDAFRVERVVVTGCAYMGLVYVSIYNFLHRKKEA